MKGDSLCLCVVIVFFPFQISAYSLVKAQVWINASSSAREVKVVACPEAMCSTLPCHTRRAASGVSRNCTTKARRTDKVDGGGGLRVYPSRVLLLAVLPAVWFVMGRRYPRGWWKTKVSAVEFGGILVGSGGIAVKCEGSVPLGSLCNQNRPCTLVHLALTSTAGG